MTPETIRLPIEISRADFRQMVHGSLLADAGEQSARERLRSQLSVGELTGSVAAAAIAFTIMKLGNGDATIFELIATGVVLVAVWGWLRSKREQNIEKTLVKVADACLPPESASEVLFQPGEVELSARGFAETDPHSSIFLDWRMFRHIARCPSHIALFTWSGGAHHLPRAAFDSQEEFDACYRLIQEWHATALEEQIIAPPA